MVEQKRGFKGVWIPKEIWLSESLSLQEKVFLVEIDSLDNEEGCYASNTHFSNFFGLSKGRCSQIIKSLIKKGFINVKYIRNEDKNIEKRVLRVVNKLNPPIKFPKYPYLENDKGSNTSKSNTSNKEQTQIEDLLPYFSSIDNHEELINKYWDVVSNTRKTGKISDNIKIRMMYKWLDYDLEVVEYALKSHVANHSNKKEEYTLGIMRNTSKEEAKSKMNDSEPKKVVDF